jgi:hypothetical protein
MAAKSGRETRRRQFSKVFGGQADRLSECLDRCGINYRYRKVLEIAAVEGQQARDPIRLHGGRQPGVVRSEASDPQPLDQFVPTGGQIDAVREENEAALEEANPLAGLGGR